MLGLGNGLEYQGTTGDGERVVIYYHDFDFRGQRRTSPANPTFIDMGSNGVFTLNNHTTYGGGMDDWILPQALEAGGGDIYPGKTFNNMPTVNGSFVLRTGVTGSVSTGASGGMVQRLSDDPTNLLYPNDGGTTSGGAHRYMFYEASGLASSTQLSCTHINSNVRAGVGLPAIDFTGYSGLKLEFWAHVFGAGFHGNTSCDEVGFAVAVTNSATSTSSANEIATGLGLSSDTAGGAEMTYTDLSGNVVTTKRLGGDGQIQTSGHGSVADGAKWIKVTADISGASGASDARIYFTNITHGGQGTATSRYQQDVCVDNIRITGLV